MKDDEVFDEIGTMPTKLQIYSHIENLLIKLKIRVRFWCYYAKVAFLEIALYCACYIYSLTAVSF